MKCPVDGETLMISDRSGVEIDFCPHCRGVWLDRGELDKIIERAAEPRQAPDHDRAGVSAHGSYDPRASKKERRESFLSELFDF
ncbi:hypothetical protein SAMN04490248_11083 [Salinihabitans flavidus]|uniref:Transcription factor zinc-finger domain-containing protein n=1 Tax=Salinihabitans flavidus TaxID=569882 RepID=A0A1H8S1V7_9RHOB|nr:zf-TFIIB domain-containing protein [Salinihabitans flavidus]SEO72516.1 hypothetical protein SAMN04490248_11083 [Salinihabitans flavidus]